MRSIHSKMHMAAGGNPPPTGPLPHVSRRFFCMSLGRSPETSGGAVSSIWLCARLCASIGAERHTPSQKVSEKVSQTIGIRHIVNLVMRQVMRQHWGRKTHPLAESLRKGFINNRNSSHRQFGYAPGYAPVSYTHLTLPTTSRV